MSANELLQPVMRRLLNLVCVSSALILEVGFMLPHEARAFTEFEEQDGILFEQASVVTDGEGDSGSGTFNAVVPVFGAGPASVVLHVLAGSAGASDYVVPTKPITLSWADGQAGTTNVLIPIIGDRLPEGDEVFCLALGETVSGELGSQRVCVVTVTDDDAGTVPEKGVYVAGVPQPPDGGSVSGSGYCPSTKNVKLGARAKAGWTFLNWEDGSQLATLTVRGEEMEDSAVLCTAYFKRTEKLALPSIVNPGDQSATVGVAFSLYLTADSECLPTVTVAGLPAGLKYLADSCRVMGVPTKAGTYSVTVAASNPKGNATPQTFTLNVDALPVWAQGEFNGRVRENSLGDGIASMTVSAKGAVSGKLTLCGITYPFSAASYTGVADGAYGLTAYTAYNIMQIWVRAADVEGLTAMLGVATGCLGPSGAIELFRDVWKDVGMATVAAKYTGYYTATLQGNDMHGSGYLTFTVDKAGKVKVGGKLADGTAVSLSGVLILDEAGRVFAVVYSAPAVYKGGCLFGLAEFVDPEAGEVILRLLDGVPFLWQSRNPQATVTFGAGFARAPGLVGGWYSKTANLAVYYAGKNLTVGIEQDTPAPELTVGATRFDSIWWSPDGIALTPTLKTGVMAGLAAPAAGKPTDADKDGVWDYSPANSVGLKVSLTRATGVFKGSFLAWFDYPVKKHVSKSLAFEGALTPVRENPEDGVEGRGFFLWPDTAVPPLPAKPYAFQWSYDFLLQEK